MSLRTRGAESVVEQPSVARHDEGGLEVVDVEADAVVGRRRRLAHEEVQLLVAQAQPLDVHVEVGAGQALHPEHLGVEAKSAVRVGEGGRAGARFMSSRRR